MRGYTVKSVEDIQAEAREAEALMAECDQYRTGVSEDDEIDAWITSMIEAGIDPFEY